MPLVSAVELSDRLGAAAGGAAPVVVDVREPEELAEGRIEGSVHVPLGALVRGEAAAEVELWRTSGVQVVTYCRSGARSAHAAAYLRDVGVAQVASLDGGIQAWGDATGGG